MAGSDPNARTDRERKKWRTGPDFSIFGDVQHDFGCGPAVLPAFGLGSDSVLGWPMTLEGGVCGVMRVFLMRVQ